MKPIYLYVTPFFPSPTSWRGSYCLDFIKALKRVERDSREGWRIEVFKPGDGSDYEIDGVTVHTFKTRQLPSNILPFLFRRYNERSFLSKVNEVLSPFSVTQVAVCHSHTANFSIYPLAVKTLNSGCLTLLHHHDLQSFGLNLGCWRHLLVYNAWLFCRMRKFFEQIDVHVFISEKSRESFLCAPDTCWTSFDDYRKQMRGPRLFHCRPVRIRRSIVLHNGVDANIFRPTDVENARGEGGQRNVADPFVIGCVGNFDELKDQETLIRAMGKVIDGLEGSGNGTFKVVFVGSGSMLERCKRLARSIEDKVNHHCSPSPLAFTFLSEVLHAELADFYCSLDLFVLPSYFEGFGCVYTEAWSCGTPFITTTGAGVDELILPEERPLWLAAPRDPEDLAKKIVAYCQNRPAQHLIAPVDINVLTKNFFDEVEQTRASI